MKPFLRTLAGTLIVALCVFLFLLVLSVPYLLEIFIGAGVLLVLGYIVGWFIWGQGPPKI